MKHLILPAILMICLGAQAVDAKDRTLVLKYTDFGPPSMAWQTIGMDWWQWNNHGDSRPGTKYDIKVVVYRSISLNHVKEMYPVAKSKEQDYRYLSYDAAIEYLERNIAEKVKDGFLPELTERLRKTKAKIIDMLGRPDEP